MLPFVKTSAHLHSVALLLFPLGALLGRTIQTLVRPLMAGTRRCGLRFRLLTVVCCRGQNSPLPRALLPCVTTSAIACVAPRDASPDERGELVRSTPPARCRRLQRWITPGAMKRAGVQ
ncbi:hypothetical protein THIOKS13320066 [Thiocapsa sp. KS1]|nr:hypothetical protein THIOKS13320066 [Thiocapsa sp. KS1]